MNYLQFVRRNARLLAFGLMLAGYSSFGQTFFISLFGEEIRGEFELTPGTYGLLYGLATIASAMALSWLGAFIDKVDLKLYATWVAVGLTGACLLMALSESIVILALALFALRLTGQGLMGHTSITSMARYFDAHRGKAISIACLGFPLGEAVLPSVVVFTLAFGTWRTVWGGASVVVFMVGIPLIHWLLHGHHRRHQLFIENTAKALAEDSSTRQFDKRDVLRDPSFYLLLPVVMAPAFLLTGVFFHHTTLIADKGWDALWFATCFVAFAVAQWPSSLLAGPLVDRMGAARLLPVYLLPFAVGLGSLILTDARWSGIVFMFLAGISAGIAGTIGGALWAEIYGVKHLGSIRALGTSAMVVSTALSPWIFGWVLDRGYGFNAILVGSVAYIAVSVSMGMLAIARRHS